MTEADADRRHPRQPFRPEVFDEYLAGRSIVAVTELSGGRVNSSFALDLDDGTRVVARQYARGSAEADAYIIGLASQVVPVPDVLAWGEGWAVMRWVPGKLLADRPAGIPDAARCLARLSTIRLERPGQLTARGIEPWDFGPHENVNEMFLAVAEVQAALGPGLLDAVHDLLVREAGRFAILQSEAVLVHGDYNHTNILVDGGRVTGILDWEFAMAGTRYGDIGNFRRNRDRTIDAAIESGFRDEGVDLPLDWRRLADLADLSSALEFLTTRRSESFKRRCIDQIQRTVEGA